MRRGWVHDGLAGETVEAPVTGADGRLRPDTLFVVYTPKCPVVVHLTDPAFSGAGEARA